MEKEVWKDINGYEELYKISNLGNVYSYYSNKTLKQHKTKGYLYVNLYKEKRKTKKAIHRLVAETFLPNPNNFKVINHINCLKTDNTLENLEWCTQNENIQHAIRNNLGVGKSLKAMRKVAQYNKNKELIKIFDSINEAGRKTNIAPANIFYSCKGNDNRGKRKTAGGFIWKFIEK